MQKYPQVSVIIPVYNVSKYIQQCCISLFGQTLDNVEFIFVDDSSTDDSVKIIKDVLSYFPNRISQVKILSNKVNMGVSYSRQIGIDNSIGEYIIHCDPDDWVELDAYESLYALAKEANSDIVGCDYIKEYVNKSVVCSENIVNEKYAVISSIMSDGNIKGFLWNRLVKRQLLVEHGICFYTGLSLWEDMSVVIPLHIVAHKVNYLPKALYHYRKTNYESIGTNLSVSKVESSIKATEYVELFLRRSNTLELLELPLKMMQLNSKKSFLFDSRVYNPNKWFNTFKSANKYICKSNLRFDLKFIMYLAKFQFFFPAKLRLKLKTIIK